MDRSLYLCHMNKIVLIFLFLLPNILFAQYQTRKGNSFPNGVYLNMEELKALSPGLKNSQILINGEKSNNIKKWFRSDSLFYMDSKSVKQLMPYSKIFAFVDDGILYVQRKGYDHKITVPGQLSYFVESYPIRRAASTPVAMERNKEVIPRILDLEKNEIVDFTVSVVEEILKERDEILFQEFTSINNPKKQRQVLLRFVERYNERHTISTLQN